MRQPWPLVPLADVLAERRETPSAERLLSGDIPIVAKIRFDNGQIELRREVATRTGMLLVYPGDLVVSGINATKGAIAIYPETSAGPIAATIHYGSYIPDRNRVELKYLWWLLRSRYFSETLLKHAPGGIKTELKARRLLPIAVPLPPLMDQRRIVKNVEQLVGRVHTARTLRQELVRQAEALLTGELVRAFETSSQQFGKRALGELLTEAGYGTSIKCDYIQRPESTRILRIPNVASGQISLADLKFGVLSERDLARVLLSPKDIVLVRTNGSLDLVGRAAVIPDSDEPLGFASYLIRLRCDWNRILPDFLRLMLEKLRLQGDLIDLARTTAGQYNVSLGRLRSAEIPVPPVEQQAQLIKHIADLRARIDLLKEAHHSIERNLAALELSILDDAFRGTQDANISPKN